MSVSGDFTSPSILERQSVEGLSISTPLVVRCSAGRAIHMSHHKDDALLGLTLAPIGLTWNGQGGFLVASSPLIPVI